MDSADTNKRFIVVIIILLVIGLVYYLWKRKKNNTTTYAWKSTPVGECSVPCGGGTQYFNVVCQATDPSGKTIIVPNSNCPSPTPPSSLPCNTDPCIWSTGDWSQCSVPCGPGTQTRQVFCTYTSGGLPIPNQYCSPTPEPATQQDCNNGSCTWQVGPWGQCSVDCGIDGTQTRTVTCPSSGGCPSPTPASSQTCPNDGSQGAVPLCTWNYSAWGDCSSACSTGSQNRTIVNCLRDSAPTPSPNCGPPGPVTQSCTGPDTGCGWSPSATVGLPYPLFSDAVLQCLTKQTCSTVLNLLQRDNQYLNFQYSATPDRFVTNSIGTPPLTQYTLQQVSGVSPNVYQITECASGKPIVMMSQGTGNYILTLNKSGYQPVNTLVLSYSTTLNDIKFQMIDSSNKVTDGDLFADNFWFFYASGTETTAGFVPLPNSQCVS